MRPQISNAATEYLEPLLDQVQRGEVELWAVPREIAAWYYAGLADARQLHTAQMKQLQRDINKLYALAYTTDKERVEHLLDRLDNGLVEASEDQWVQLETDLRAMQTIKFYGLKEAVDNTAEVGHNNGEHSRRAA